MIGDARVPATQARPGFRPRPGLCLAAFVALCLMLGIGTASAVTLPPSFVIENEVPSVTFVQPTSMAFLPDGRLLVGEKRGKVWMVRNHVRLATPVWDHTTEVMDLNDRGLLAIAVDPDWVHNHYLYLLYNVDPDTNGVDLDVPTFGRLVRYQMNAVGDTNVTDPASRTVLFGTDWAHGPLVAMMSHSIGGLRWGADGSLFASAGDGGDWTHADAGGLYPAAFGPGRTDPYEDIGAYRAQDIHSLCGKILRINPHTGHGYASNPYADGDLMSVR